VRERGRHSCENRPHDRRWGGREAPRLPKILAGHRFPLK
jgi:hypothetical protein